MSTKVTPEKRVVVCDCCQREVGALGVWRKQNGSLMLNRDLLDYQGYPCASGNTKLDLCDNCLPCISGAINSACDKVRADIANAIANGSKK